VTSRELVRRAVEFENPARIPYSFIAPVRSDFFEIVALEAWLKSRKEGTARLQLGAVYYDEWGVGQKVTHRSWDQVIHHPLSDLRALDDYRVPDVAAPERFTWLAPFVRRAQEAGKYVVGGDPVLMYERMRALMGFEELMKAPYVQPGPLEALLDRLTDLTIAVIEQFSRIGGVDGFMTWQDHGGQERLQMGIETFRQFYKPRYQRIVEATHAAGMHYIWHNCGQIVDMIPDMIEIGVDVVQLDQPRLLGHRLLADRFGGKICFWNTVDIQWAASGTPSQADLRAEVAAMTTPFERFTGGLMVRHYPQPWDIGLATAFHEATYEAFLENGCALSGVTPAA
jgi:hypothetical protein